ncbi:Histidinol dehydrogenase [Fructobacillus sp. EFB-N1]|uniref:histidinol dehydrogenase n=1 Tax=Fructobacillus sp. EFB-N1 TaxID=1658766 RepID=UPI00064D74E4|nr:histidinol dehydrogenase [Fructobacillus sp. EFB-N1]KMK53332.1 Histidinol dehydrogenase [Fructobacillus sp. EFB-N1]
MKIIEKMTPTALAELRQRSDTNRQDEVLTQQVQDIIATVQKKGDQALKEYSQAFDRVQLNDLRVPAAEIQAAFDQVDEKVVTSLKEAAENIRSFHQLERAQSFEDKSRAGVIRGTKVTPLAAVGIYVPGGTAAYPSSVLMNAIPAKIAGVNQIVMVTPPQTKGINPAVLVAASIAGVDEIYQIGGAQAIAALAFGTETIPQVDKITGPGNAYVAEAKRQVYGTVAIDMIAGPSEIGILADETANAKNVAADLLSQAEHDVRAQAMLVTNSTDLAQGVMKEVDEQLAKLPRREIVSQSIANNGVIYLVETVQEMLDTMNKLAPEHLEIQLENPSSYLDQIQNAGSVFLGPLASEPLGDYLAGPNHILPTGGTARFSSALGVWDFQKKIQYLEYDQEALIKDAPFVTAIAREEGLEGHARAIESRVNADD